MDLTAPRAALLDLDGTLLDTLQDLADAVNAALQAQGLRTLPTDGFRLLVGTGARNLARLATVQALRDAGADEADAAERAERLAPAVFRDFQDAYAVGWDRATRPYAGVPEALEALRGCGVPLGILSNKPDAFTKSVVARYFPGIPFATVCGERDGVPRKPDPASADAAKAAFGLSGREIAYIGDSGTDMAFAVAAGFLPVGVLWGFRDRAELEASGAERLLADPREIPALFAGASAADLRRQGGGGG